LVRDEFIFELIVTGPVEVQKNLSFAKSPID